MASQLRLSADKTPHSRRLVRFAWLLILAWYFLATLPYLTDYPVVEAAQMGIAAPAYKLASQGVYGNDLYRGFFNADLRNYDHMPLYPLALALSFKLFGLGVAQGRLVSILCGLATLVLTYLLGKRLFDVRVGLLATLALCVLPLTVEGHSAGLLYPGRTPLLDIARVMRYDIMVPVWVLSACLWFFRGQERDAAGAYFLAGVCAGLATLTHLYGAFILAPLIWLLIGGFGPQDRQFRPLLWLLAGCFVALLPWALYVLGDLPAYRGQLLRHQSKFDLAHARFYLDNLLREPWRYVKFFGRFRDPVLWPRPGFWVMVGSLLTANVIGWRRRQAGSLEARFLLLSLPALAFLLALLISFKRYTYVVLLLPFLALQVACGVVEIWAWVRTKTALHRALFGLVLLAALVEGVQGVWRNLQAASQITPYIELTDDLRAHMPPGSRVLMLHAFWLGLADYDALALDMTFSLTNPDFGAGTAPSMTEVMNILDPDFVLTKEELRTAYLRTPLDAATAKLAEPMSQLDRYLVAECALVYMGPRDPAYDTPELWRCSPP